MFIIAHLKNKVNTFLTFFMKINEIRPLEHGFTEVLNSLVLNIKMLYYYGKLPKKCPTVAIVGARKNTSYGYEVAYKAAYAAAKAGVVVVSGLAYGIDSIAHRGALDAGGVTVAVLGTPITEIYPKEHRGLAQEIIEKGGAVMSEYGSSDIAKGGQQMKVRFLERNRIISGLSDVVMVVEAADRSGSLNTATHALNQGKELMVVPGDITRAASKGCNKLLAQGAHPYTEEADLLELLFPLGCGGSGSNGSGFGSSGSGFGPSGSGSGPSGSGSGPNRVRLSTQEKKLQQLSTLAETEVETQILGFLVSGICDGEEIIEKGEISAAEFSQAMTILEIKGAVRALGANRWMVR